MNTAENGGRHLLNTLYLFVWMATCLCSASPIVGIVMLNQQAESHTL